ncbi:hypothetical protein [Bradyrhizobium sp. SRS-191]|uniref:hypothetical protein n=1 Tax=Bradyrhizobium sp. SRS-191 TaxID=2962606 RepID=UPI00211EDEC4|nr:hypothetical protein [Bradyrhizobium sp. SRS-191]
MPEALRAITFEQVPTDIDAPVIVEATIQDETVLSNDGVSQMVVMRARIDRVIKGDIDVRTLKIVVDAKRCTRTGVGHGIVLGRLQDDPVHGTKLEAVQDAKVLAWSKDFAQKQMDLLNSAVCVKNEYGFRECRLTWPIPYLAARAGYVRSWGMTGSQQSKGR